jgi:Kef-type K+ transport system membrane component KefB
VVSGTQFDLHVFIDRPESLWRVAVFVVLMLAARGIPVFMLYREALPRAQRLPMALLSATGLPLIVVITGIATAEGRILPVNAAALVAAGMVTVLVFPATGFWRMRKLGPVDEPQESAA